MPTVHFKDAAGVSITFTEVDGILYPAIQADIQEQVIRAVKNLAGQDDDVLLASYNKSGSNWLWEVLSMLYRGNAETIPGIKMFNMVEALTADKMDSLPSPRVLNSHIYFHSLPPDMIKRKTKIVLIHRNPKDIAVSLYNHHFGIKVYDYNGKWQDWFPLFLEGKVDNNSWFDYVKHWERVMAENPDYPIHLMYYEDMKEDSFREIKKLVKFLGLRIPQELCKAVADKCQFEKMKVDKKGLEDDFWRTVWKNEEPTMYRKGIVGDWKNWFTVAQNEIFDKLYKEKMKDSKLNIRFEI